MPVIPKQALIDSTRFRNLYTAGPIKLRVTIDKINGQPAGAESPQLQLKGLKHGVNGFISPDPFEIRMTALQCTPIGIVRAKLTGGGQSVSVDYTVRTGVHA